MISIEMHSDLLFEQLFESESSTYTYLLADAKSYEAVIIDPVKETTERDIEVIQKLGLKLLYILETHLHADHITGADELRKKFGAKTGISQAAKVTCADLQLTDGQNISFGKFNLKAMTTPGHTNSCMSFYLGDRVFTGDTLLIGGCGRTDFQEGSAEKLYESVTQKLFTLPPDTIVYPAHDYSKKTSSSIEIEMKTNPRLGNSKTKEEFLKIMNTLKLSLPKKIHEALPANLACGRMA